MKTVRLFLAGYKGLHALQRLVKDDIYLSMISNVEIGGDHFVIQDYSEDIRKICIEYNIRTGLGEVESDFTIAIGWRKILHGITNLICLHDSLLPKYRGFAPVVNSLINGEGVIGATAFWAVEEMDAGKIIDQRSLNITYPITIAETIDLLGVLYADMVEELFYGFYKSINIPSKEQEGIPTYSMWRGKEDYQIDWSWGAAKVCRFVDAVGFPYLGAVTSEIRSVRKVLILKCEEVLSDRCIVNRSDNVGKVFSIAEGYPVVVCGQGLIKITRMIDEETKENIIPWCKLKTKFV